MILSLIILSGLTYFHYLGIKNQKMIKTLNIGDNILIANELLGKPNSIIVINDSINAYIYRPPLFSSDILELRYNTKNSKIVLLSY